MKLRSLSIAALASGVAFMARAADQSPDPSAGAAADAQTTLEQRLQRAEERIKVLERRLELADETATTAAKAAPVVKAAPAGLSISSGDAATVIKLRGNLAVDGRFFLDQNTPGTADGFLFRRVRPYIEGTVGSIYDFRFMPDFGGGRAIVQDAYLNARFKPWLALQAGKFKGPVGLERLQPDQYNRFMELGFPSGLVPNRDLGIQLSGTLLGGALSYAAGYFNGTADGGSTDANATPDADNDGKRDWEGRLFALPFANSDSFALRGLGIGVGASYLNSTGVATSSATAVSTTSLLPTYRTPGQQSLFSYRGDTASTATINEATVAAGVRRRVSPQLYYYVGPFGLLGEYAQVTQQVRRQIDATTTRYGSLQHSAWQVSASWFLTGEEAAYAAFTTRSSFLPGKPGSGAIELVARVQGIHFDDEAFSGGATSFANPASAVHKADALGFGLNWYLSQNFKWQLNYEVTRFTGGAASGDRPDERAALTRFALIF